MKQTNRFVVTLPEGLERTIETAAKHRHCSKAEIIRAALYESLREFLSQDNAKTDGGQRIAARGKQK